MKRLQIYIQEELDEALGLEASRTGTSKAALIRRFVAERLQPPSLTRDPLEALIGAYEEEPGSIDEVVYGP
ncbi:MAG: ribbon-helix-helix protein, CopG family [Actinobacteria bacterium]|nr:ribbon-helix-helix protein, CopG family [Actinomycetota bacterium]